MKRAVMPLSGQDLDRMIREAPQPLREELIDSVRRLEAALELTGLALVPWTEALRRYRARRAVPSQHPAALGLLDPAVLQYAKSVDEALQRIRKTPELKASLETMLQREKSSKAAEDRRARKEQADAARRQLIEAAWYKAMGRSKRDPSAVRNSQVYLHFENAWAADQEKRPAEQRRSPPSLNTVKGLIDELRLELKERHQSPG